MKRLLLLILVVFLLAGCGKQEPAVETTEPTVEVTEPVSIYMSNSSVEAALVIVDELQEHGFRFVTVSELAQAKGITPIPGKEYRRFVAAEDLTPVTEP